MLKRRVGFTNKPWEWTGPEAFHFQVYDETVVNSVRYRCFVKNRYFDLYVPRAVFNGDRPPQQLNVTITDANSYNEF